MRAILRLLGVAAGLYLAIAVLVYLFQRRLQYFPDPHDPPPPRGAEDVHLRASDGVALRGWYWPGAKPPAVLVLHGNAGHRGDRLPLAEGLRACGYGVLLLDYRGYGGSGGSPTEQGLLLDAEAAVRWLRDRGADRLVYFGESLGCGVAAALAAREAPAGLVFQSGADSLAPVAQKAYPWLPVRWLMRDRFEAARALESVRCPVLSIHGTADRLVPLARGRALHDAAPGRKEWFEVRGAGHNDVAEVAGAAYYARLDLFLASLDE